LRQGTRASARIRGQGPKATPEPTPIETKNKRGKRGRQSGGKNKAVEPPEKRPKRLEDETADTPMEVDVPAPDDDEPVDPVPNNNTTPDHLEQPAEVEAEERGSYSIYTPEEREYLRNRRFFLREENGMFLIGLGLIQD